MNNRNAIIAVILVILVVLGMFLYAHFKSSQIQTVNTDQSTSTQNENPAPTPYDNITRIDAKHFFIDGTHTLVGEINMPTPCDLLTWDSVVAESDPEQVTVKFNVINNAETCAQVVTPQRFKVSFDAGENAVIKATFMDRSITLNLIPPAEGETPDDFELFIKG